MCIEKIGQLVKKWGEGEGDTPLKMALSKSGVIATPFLILIKLEIYSTYNQM